MQEWVTDEYTAIAKVFASGVVFYLVTILGSKLAGIRSFTKASSFDFLVTLAMGALMASTVIDQKISLLEGTVAVASLYMMQNLIASIRMRWAFINRYIDNQPIMLMEHGKFLEDNMRKINITHEEVNAKLRSCNINNYTQVRAVVLESSGSVSVLKNDPGNPVDPSLLEGVRI